MVGTLVRLAIRILFKGSVGILSNLLICNILSIQHK